MLDSSYPTSLQGFSAGMIKDTSRLNQPKDSYRFLLNGLLESKEGDVRMISNERGNVICAELPEGFRILGHRLLDNNDVVLLLSDDTTSIIGIQSKDCTFTIMVKSSCLGFNSCYAIDAEFRLRKGCERTIYLTDGLNPIYAINLDSLQDYVLDSVTVTGTQEKINYANENDAWDCDKFRIFPNVSVPKIELEAVRNSGGYTPVGSYQFSVRLLDADRNPTQWFYVSPVVPIYDEALSIRYRLIDGGLNSTNSGVTSNDDALPPTSKSIELKISNLDLSYSYYQIAVLQSSSRTQSITEVYIKPEVPLTSTEDIYVFTGKDSSVDVASTKNEVVIPKESINTAKHIVQTDNRLLLANTKGKSYDWAKFQRKASKIGSKYIVTEGRPEVMQDKSPKSPSTYFDYLSYMRDEIYAYAIVWVFNDGTYSPAFHIPGRAMNYNPIDCQELPLTGSGTSSFTYPCIIISYFVSGAQIPPSNATTIEITYTLNGETFTELATLSGTFEAGPGTYQFNCFDPGDVVTVESYSVLQTGVVDDVIAVTVSNITSNNTGQYGGDPSIPPAIDGWDSSFVGSIDPNTNHLPPVGTPYFQRWQVYNTAFKLGASQGLFAYTQCSDSTYPHIADCNGESIWGTDICGNTLEGNPIRHHKFPAASLEPLISGDPKKIRYVGAEFFNIYPPEEYENEIQGYYIVRGNRDDINSTILDKGYIDHAEYLSKNDDDRANLEVENPEDPNAHITYVGLFPPFSYLDDHISDDEGVENAHRDAVVLNKVWSFHSPRMYFNRDYFPATFIKVEHRHLRQGEDYTEYGNLSLLDRDSWDVNVWQFSSNTIQADPGEINRTILDSTYLDARLGPSRDSGLSVSGSLIISHPTGNKTATVKNHLISNHIHLLSLESDLNPIYWHYVALKVNRDVYCTLPSIKYLRTHTGIKTGASSGNIHGGDIHISRINPSFQTLDDDRGYLSCYCESVVNSELRHSAPGICDNYFQGDDITSDNVLELLKWMTRYSADEVFQNDDHVNDGNGNPHEWCCSDYWAYNPDYSKQQIENLYFPLSYSYNYCSPCVSRYPYRIYYSEQSFQEEQTDNYRAYLVNNYTDLMGDQGEITNLFIDRDRLFSQTRKALWQIQTRPNEIVTSEETIFVGAGTFLSIPPRKLVSTEYGYGGSTQKWATITTEFGTSIVDSTSGKIFLMDQGLKEIGQAGIRNWLEENLEIEFAIQFKRLTGIEYPCQEPVTDKGIGIRTVYDPRHRRLIFHKRDFSFTAYGFSKFGGAFASLNDVMADNGQLIYLKDLNIFAVYSEGDYTETKLNNDIYFENNSWTMSFSLSDGLWLSYHSYMPHYMFNDEDYFYTHNANGDNVTWKHPIGPFQTFYGYKHPMIIEYIVNTDPALRKRFYTLDYAHELFKYNSALKEYTPVTDKTFDSIYFYTETDISSSSTIELKSQPYQGIQTNPLISYARRRFDWLRINNNMRDISLGNDEPLFTSGWGELFPYFNVDTLGNGYVDRVPNELARDVNTSSHLRSRIRGRWMGVRLEFNPEEDIRMVFQLSNISYAKEN